jgi:hypothetical protein
VTALAISADGKTLYAATDGEGVFRLDQAQIPQSTLIPTATITPLPTTSSPTVPQATRTPTAFLVLLCHLIEFELIWGHGKSQAYSPGPYRTDARTGRISRPVSSAL